MDRLELETLPAELDALARELEAERGRSVAGVEKDPALARLFLARSRAAHRATAAALREAGKGALADRVSALRVERAASEQEEAWRAAEARASAIGPDGPAPLAALELALVRERDRGRRRGFARAAAEALGPSASAREAMLEVRARAGAEVGIAPDWQAVVEGDQLLAATDDAYLDVLAFRARHDLALSPAPSGDLARADLLHLLSLQALRRPLPAVRAGDGGPPDRSPGSGSTSPACRWTRATARRSGRGCTSPAPGSPSAHAAGRATGRTSSTRWGRR